MGTKSFEIKLITCIDVLSIILAYYIFNYLDILTTDYQWIIWMKENGLFHIYDSWDITNAIDYPPLYLIWLYAIRNLVGDIMSNYTQLVMKSLPLLFLILSQMFIYKRLSPSAALKWSLNLALLVNIIIYGQRDGIIGLLIVFFFYFIKEEKWFEPAITIAIFCLLKPQGFYMIFPLLLYYVTNKISCKKIMTSFFTCIALGYLVFLPFAITSKDYLISIKLYLYAFSKHNVFSSCAGNFWGIFDFFHLPMWIENISLLLIIFCIVISILIYKKTYDYIYTSIFYMMSLFMFTFAQHGRYSIYTMFIMYIAIYMYDDQKYINLYRWITFSTAIAQLGIITYNYVSIMFCGFNNINSGVSITYTQLYIMSGIRALAIIITLIPNVIIYYKLLRLPQFVSTHE